MKFYRMPIAEARLGDHPAMVYAIDVLLSKGIEIRRPLRNVHQLKVSEIISYYPSKGTIFFDGHPAPLSERGLEALLELLENPPVSISALMN